MMKHCPKCKIFDNSALMGGQHMGMGAVTLVKSLSDLPVLESVKFGKSGSFIGERHYSCTFT